MKRYNWDSVPESTMPAEAGEVLRRFIGGDKMTVARVAFAAGSITPEHSHENEQFTVVLAGTMEFLVEGEPVRVEAGEILHLPSNEKHGAKALTEAVVLDIFAPPRADWGAPPSPSAE